MLPGEFLQFVSDKIKNWTIEQQEDAKFLSTWALAACCATNKYGDKGSSQLGLPLVDFDLGTDTFDKWADSRLIQTLGSQVQPATGGGGSGGGNGGFVNGGFQPIIQVNMPTLPQPTLDEMDLAYHRGVDVHKRATEKDVLRGYIFSERQLVHLLAFWGIWSGEEDMLPYAT